MLPDFISLKRQVSVDMEGSLSTRKDPFMSLIPTYIQHEGRGSIICRDDGSQHKSEHKKIGSEITIDLREVQSKGEAVIRDAFMAAHEKVEASKKKWTMEVFEKTVEEVGNSLNAMGQPLSAELILETWEKIDFSFDDDGNWEQPTLVFNPVQEARLKAALERLETDPQKMFAWG